MHDLDDRTAVTAPPNTPPLVVGRAIQTTDQEVIAPMMPDTPAPRHTITLALATAGWKPVNR